MQLGKPWPSFSSPVSKSRANTLDSVFSNQALPNNLFESPRIEVQFGKEILFTFSGVFDQTGDKLSWVERDEWSCKSIPPCEMRNSLLSSPKSITNTEASSLSPQKPVLKGQQEQGSDRDLYPENRVGLLKKQLELKYKGLLSKSTDSDPTLGIAVVFRFKCKNSANNRCQFLHTLEYFKEVEGVAYYRHIQNCSTHNPECILDSQNIQYNVIMRKIDCSMEKLEMIIESNPLIKPKEILQVFAKSIGQDDQNFLYEGLSTRNVRRSIKKYFDNAVAKVKVKLRQ